MKSRKYVYILVFAICALLPKFALAADDPAAIVKNVTNGLINFFMIVAPSIGTAAIMALGTMYTLTNNAGKKSEYKRNMKDTVVIVAVVLSAGAIMKWFIGLLG